METLFALEEKIKALVAHAHNLKEKLDCMQPKNNALKIENEELKAEVAKLTDGNAQLTIQLNAIESSMLLETGHINELKEERSVTRLVLDDLIKSIDSIVENEN